MFTMDAISNHAMTLCPSIALQSQPYQWGAIGLPSSIALLPSTPQGQYSGFQFYPTHLDAPQVQSQSGSETGGGIGKSRGDPPQPTALSSVDEGLRAARHAIERLEDSLIMKLAQTQVYDRGSYFGDLEVSSATLSGDTSLPDGKWVNHDHGQWKGERMMAGSTKLSVPFNGLDLDFDPDSGSLHILVKEDPNNPIRYTDSRGSNLHQYNLMTKRFERGDGTSYSPLETVYAQRN